MSQIIGPPPLQPPSSPLPPAVRNAWYRRPIVIIPVVLATAAAVATLVLVLAPRTITEHGIVLDRLTGQPVATATLHADGKATTTNARGAFRMPDLARHARLRVQARYYASIIVTATGTPLTVRLAPIPVNVTVTSALTGRPLAAMLTMPNRTRAAVPADGTATLYRIGPGDTVTATAPGFRSAQGVIRPDRTVRVTLEPTLFTMSRQLRSWVHTRHYQAIINWVLRPATRYTFMGTSPHDWAKLNKKNAGDTQAVYYGGGYTNTHAGALVSVNIWIGRPGHHWETAGLAGWVIGAPAHQVMLAGQRAFHGGPDSYHNFSTIWSYDPVSILTIGSDQPAVDAVMTGIIRAMTGTAQGT